MQDVLEETLLQLQAFMPKPGEMCCCLSVVAPVDQHTSMQVLLLLHMYAMANVCLTYCLHVGMISCLILVNEQGWLPGMA